MKWATEEQRAFFRHPMAVAACSGASAMAGAYLVQNGGLLNMFFGFCAFFAAFAHFNQVR